MDFIIEMVFSIIFEGSFELVGEKNVPLFVRIFSAVVLIVFCVGITALAVFLWYIAIRDGSAAALLLGVIVTLIAGFGVIAVIKNIKCR